MVDAAELSELPHHLDTTGRRRRVVAGSGGTACLSAATGEGTSLAQRNHRVSAALIPRPRVRRTHARGELREPAVKRLRRRRGHRAVDVGHPVGAGVDRNVAIPIGGLPAFVGGVGISGAHRGVHRVDDPLPRRAPPGAQTRGQRLVDAGDKPRAGAWTPRPPPTRPGRAGTEAGTKTKTKASRESCSAARGRQGRRRPRRPRPVRPRR